MKQTNHTIQVTINANPDAIWDIISSGTDVDKWLAPIVSCRVEGHSRYCATAEGVLEEHLNEVDHENKIFSYSILKQQMLPIEDIQGSMKVDSVRPDVTNVTWSWDYKVSQENSEIARQGLTQVGTMGIHGLRDYANAMVH